MSVRSKRSDDSLRAKDLKKIIQSEIEEEEDKSKLGVCSSADFDSKRNRERERKKGRVMHNHFFFLLPHLILSLAHFFFNKMRVE
jgi:hypothetical protein